MRGRLTSFAIALALAPAGCSLLAPSDAELMDGGKSGGGQTDSGAGDASTADASDDAADGEAGSDAAVDASDAATCGNLNDLCGTGACCAGLSCQLGTCLPCKPTGASCTPNTASDCCSGTCATGHSCQ